MRCPLLAAAHVIAGSFEAGRKSECGKEECAWCEKEANDCCFLVLERHMVTLEKMLGLILEKKPTPPTIKR